MNHTIKRICLIMGSVMLVFFSFIACNDDNSISGPNENLDVVETMQDSGEFSTLLSIATDLGLVETLRNNELTAFAPTDAAFDALPDGLLEDLTDEQLTEIITYHLVNGTVGSTQIDTLQEDGTRIGESIGTLQGESIYIRNTGSSVIVNGTASVALGDLSATNGVVHAVNEVLLPDAYGTVVDNAVKRFDLSTLVGLLTDQGLVSTLADTDSEFTVFAPTNAAFSAIRSTLGVFTDEQVDSTLLYHVLDSAVLSSQLSASQSVATLNDGEEILIEVSEGVVTINGSATVKVADVNSTNGVIHIIDEVLIPEALKDIQPPADANPIVGEWSVDPTPGSLAVGPSPDNLTWYSITSSEIAERGCFYDDLYVFNSDGSFENQMQDETWVEAWQEGVEADGCAAPVPPHDGSTVGTWEVDGSSVTISGEGLFLGLAKVHNDGENGDPANDTITYQYSLSEDESMLEVTIQGWLADVPDATWYFRFVRQ
ncbi:fasciclin domain-containing protein [Rhodohalobacter sp. 8-1]|uniref:fasciclin domain-containing protein n=1 Tax=Rhodohalobacter sp. 8-1 TaxID=3131972 RepID=UPI0030EC0695